MLKAQLEHETWLVQQHHHAQVSGYLAAHWGGANGFARPGHAPGIPDPDRLHDEIILGIAEHDNGWWETEAMPRISAVDGLPIGVGEAAAPTVENEFDEWRTGGFDRWKTGINRIATPHPYGALLISLHAYWLYAVAFDDLASEDADRRRHFVFGSDEAAAGLVGDASKTRAFLDDLVEIQNKLKSRIAEDPAMAPALEQGVLDTNLRLLQLMDSMSLYLALNDTDDHELASVPRGGWDDPCAITWRRRDDRTIELDPFPFDTNGLVVPMPARVIPKRNKAGAPAVTPMANLHAAPIGMLEFRLESP